MVQNGTRMKKYIASVNAIAKQGDLIVTSDRLEAYYKDSDKNEENIDIIKAIGNVRIKIKMHSSKVKMRHISLKRIFIINGENIKLKSKENKLFADKKIEFWRLENIAVATGNAIAKKNEYTIKANRLAWYLEIVGKEKITKLKKLLDLKM